MNRIIALLLCGIFTTQAQNSLPTQTSSLFSGSGNCVACHSSNGTTVLTHNGTDISPVTHWRSSIMANSSKDPLWRAFVAAEGIEFPALINTIETTCTRCHAPLGWAQAKHDGQEFFTMAQMKASPMANDGVSCTLCHQIDPGNMGSDSSYSGGYTIKPSRTIYGPYTNPLTGPMITSVNYTSVFSPHIGTSELCATCHTLFTPYFDSQNQPAGYFPEQTPYIEWKNSVYSQGGVQCQTCHMPSISDGIDISTTPPWHTTLRSPFWKHEFAGSNLFMLNMLKDNITTLGLTASASHFDTTMMRTAEMTKQKSVSLSLQNFQSGSELVVKVRLQNLAGHKIPSGIPLRRMWIHLTVSDQSGSVIFESGAWDTSGEIIGKDSIFEPHHDLITSEDQVQIYEPVLANSDGQLTYTLLRAAGYIKDNRLPPAGFSSGHLSYDTVKIYGVSNDLNFNIDENGTEGTGADITEYRIPVSVSGNLIVSAEVCFQTVKPEIIHHLSHLSHPDIQQFLQLYQAQGNQPEILAQTSSQLLVTGADEAGTSAQSFRLLGNYPNPFNSQTVITYEVGNAGHLKLLVYDVMGRIMLLLKNEFHQPGMYEVDFSGENLPSGIYFCAVESAGTRIVKKMVLMK